jgi:putative tricarboxylic transport membrane protein
MTISLSETVVAVIEYGPVLVAGLIFGLAAGLTPGISGRIGLLIALPVALWFDPVGAAVFLIAMHAVVHTSSAVPAVLLGLPTSSSEAATVVDGWPMMQAGRGGEAVGAILAASLAGGVLGAVALLFLAPLGGSIARHFTSAEVAALSATGLLAIAALSGKSLALGLVVAALGVLAATVGVDPHTAAQRFTFGRLELWDGLNIGAIVAGLFVIPGLLRDQRGGDVDGLATPGRPPPRVRYADVFAGCRQTVRNGWLVLRSSILGIVVGLVPGLGASVAVWLAYGHASTSTRPDVPFGRGAIEGVIAPEAANNSKEGGAMLPTLLFAVPGTTSMGILLGAFALLGIEVGPGMVAHDPWIIQLAGWVILVANLLAFPICLAAAPLLTRLATLHRALVVPFALMAATVAALAISPSAETLAQVVIFGALGTVLAHLDWPRAPFVLGFVIGPILEGALTRTILTVGTGALQRPMVLVIAGLAVATVVFWRWGGARRKGAALPAVAEGAEPSSNTAFSIVLLATFGLATAAAWSLPGQSSILPILVGAWGLAATLAALVIRRPPRRLASMVTPSVLALFLGLLSVIWLVGPPLASAAFAVVYYARFTCLPRRWLVPVAFGFAAVAWILAGEAIGLLRPLTALGDLVLIRGP